MQKCHSEFAFVIQERLYRKMHDIKKQQKHVQSQVIEFAIIYQQQIGGKWNKKTIKQTKNQSKLSEDYG